jgi:von Willebrand factor type A domain
MEATLNIDRLSLSASRRHVTVMLGIDVSMSMTTTFRESVFGQRKSRLQVAAAGACRVIDGMSDGDHVFVYSFGEDINAVTDGAVQLIDRSRAQVKQSINRLSCNGRTKLYDTLLLCAGLVLQVVAQSIEHGGGEDMGTFWLVILTDGEDTHSSSSYNDVTNVFRQLSGLPAGVLNIALIGVSLADGPRTQLQTLAQLGGSTTKFVDARNLAQVTNAFDEIAVSLQLQRVSVPLGSTTETTSGLDDSGKWDGGHISNGSHVRVLKGPHSGKIGVATDRKANRNYVVGLPMLGPVQFPKEDVIVDVEAELIRPGAIVKVKSTVATPTLGWDQFSRGAHGFVREVSESGIVVVEIGAADGSKWRAPLEDLTVAHEQLLDESLKVGAAVRVPSWKDPSTGWGNLAKNDVGYIRSYDPSTMLHAVDFPSVDGWKGRAGDLQVETQANRIRPGKYVR